MKSTLGKKVFGNRASPDIMLWHGQLVIDHLSTHSDIEIIAMSDLELFQKILPILKIQASLISLLWTDCFKECSIPSAPLLDTNYLPDQPPQPQCALTWFTASDDDGDGHTSDVLWDWQTTKRKTTKNIHPPTCPLDKWREEGSETHQRQGVIANTYINL